MSEFRDRFTIEGRGQRYRWPIAMSHRLTLLLSDRLPSAVPVVFVSGFPKSGTTWVSQLVADYLQLPFPQLSVAPLGFPAVFQGHQSITARRPHSIYVVRDGRDALLSFYFAASKRISERDNPRVPWRLRRHFAGMRNKGDVVHNLPGFIEAMMAKPLSTNYNWPNHVRTFLRADMPNVPLVRFESLLSDGEATLSTAIRTLTGEEPDREEILATLNRYSFGRQIRRRPDELNKRKGESGDWRNYFSRRAAEVFDHYAGDTLIDLNYESDRSWIERCAADEKAFE